MNRLPIVVFGFLLGGLSGLVWSSGAALAQTVLQPVQHVYPDSTLDEIQQAIDNGGTVYFERLTRTSRQIRDYNQVASSKPDLPVSADNPGRGFNIGKSGKEVNIIGVLGPDGERPKINGGNTTFRVGVFPAYGFNGLPVSFRLENLEVFNPDMSGPGGLNSRIGVWILNVLGSQTTINNCKFTISPKPTDPGHASNHSVAIWVYLGNTTQRPPSGATIDITNNTIIASRVHEGLHVDSFWSGIPGHVPPRAFISNNNLQMTHIGGYPNKSAVKGNTQAVAIIVVGNLSNSIITNNVISGYARSPGITPPVDSVGIHLGALGDAIHNVTVVGNDMSALHSDIQLRIGQGVSGNTVARNAFGPATIAGVLVEGKDSWFDRNYFYGDYPGWDPATGGTGLMCFLKTSSGNRLTHTILNRSLNICGQVDDQTAGENIIPGYEKCSSR